MAIQKTLHTSWYAWPFEAANQAGVAGWSFWLGIIGFIVSLLGFAVTIYQLQKTRSAADAAKDEARRIEGILQRYEVASEATRASAALGTAKNYVRNGLWPSAADSYEIVRDGLLALRSEAVDLTDDHRKKIDEACAFIKELCAKIERDVQRGRQSTDVAKVVAVMSEHSILLSEITRIIQKGVIK
ncbi:MAG: hypothetical protein ACOY5R_11450 [Pseudomonadota bacterium]